MYQNLQQHSAPPASIPVNPRCSSSALSGGRLSGRRYWRGGSCTSAMQAHWSLSPSLRPLDRRIQYTPPAHAAAPPPQSLPKQLKARRHVCGNHLRDRRRWIYRWVISMPHGQRRSGRPRSRGGPLLWGAADRGQPCCPEAQSPLPWRLQAATRCWCCWSTTSRWSSWTTWTTAFRRPLTVWWSWRGIRPAT
jgi:hypothetical protein